MGEQDMQSQDTMTASEPVRHQVHHSYIWLGTLRVVLVVFVAVVISMFSSIIGAISEGMHGGGAEVGFVIAVTAGISFAAFVVFTGLVFLVHWLAYKRLYYVLGPDEFNLYSGIITKKRVHVPYNKVQSVDQKASLLQRIAGVRTLYIDTAGGANNKAIVVPYVTKHDAEWLRSELFARKDASIRGVSYQESVRPQTQATCPQKPQAPVPPQDEREGCNILDVGQEAWDELGGVFAGEAYDGGRVSYEYGLSNKELVLAGLSNNTSFAVLLMGIVIGIVELIGSALDILPADEVDVFSTMVRDTGMHVIQSGMFALAATVIGIILVVWILSVIGSCIGYGGFRARRRESRIEVEYGLLQHTFQGVDIERVQAVVITQSFIRRLFGYCEVSLAKVDANVEGDDGKNARAKRGIVIHPFVKLAKVPQILAGLVPEFEDVPTDQRKVAPVALRRALTRRCIVQGTGFWLAVIVAVFQLTMGLWLDDGIVRMHVPGGYVTMDVYGLCNSICMICYVLAVVITIVSAIGAVLWARSSSFAFNHRFMQVTNGGFSTSTVTFPRQKIQYGYTKTNPLQRMAHTATIKARTAAGVGGTTYALIDATQEDAEAWLAWLEPRGLR